MTEVAAAFLLQKQVTGCSSRTVAVYTFWLDRLAAAVPDTAALDSVSPGGVKPCLFSLRRPFPGRPPGLSHRR